ncbi:MULTISPECIES: galactose/methyl galactoside ABC transporter permease MglC [Sorangium]|uniref:Beta-methylgalactoside transporter n=1 Tax=Sorangium cellulosum TaxID=56 RepID=A0A4P2QFG4_SORCE|nr:MULTISPECIES: galactose/methyl galactoside ABC transporter permease MglC [Sorangium]AUX28226.1 beta-methylgalactoside transporter [Sorangium cellulosum]WCQ87622.1 Galactoside transport system permease protein MglC [Sorangium sp. Soce836]
MATSSAGGAARDRMRAAREFASRQAISLVLLLLVLVIGVMRPSFLSVANLINVLIISSVRVIIALGEGGVLITRGTDLSAGRTVGLAACIAASLLQRPDYASRMYPHLASQPVLLCIVAAVSVGAAVGLINGSIVAFLNVPPFIATLGTMIMAYGAASLYVDRPPLGAQPIGGLRDDFTAIGTGAIRFGGDWALPYLVIIAAVITVAIWVLLNQTRLGKNIYAIGSSREAAVVSGVDVPKTLLLVYLLAGALYGLAGALLAARTGGATNNYGLMYELDAIAACVIGGVSTSGGVGTVGGILTGVLIFEVLNNGLVILGVSPYWQQIIKGIIIVAAVSVDIRKYLRKR